MQDKQKILIVGGGFGGIKTALELEKNSNFDVTLISERENFRYYPTIFHAVTGGKPIASSIPLKQIVGDKNIKIVIDEILTLDRASKTIAGKSGKKYKYDSLILALGVVTNYFGIKGLDKYSFGVKSLEDAQKFHDHLHKTAIDADSKEMNYVIIGGGPTGIELAGNLPRYLTHLMFRHNIKPKKIHIDLVEAMPRLMPKMSKKHSKKITRRLKKLGIDIMLGKKVEAETKEALRVSGHNIKTHNVVWTAGVANHPFFTKNNFRISADHKIVVDPTLRAEEDIYVIGDNADTKFSGVAQTALYDAKFIANNLRRLSRGKLAKLYKPKMPIYITPVGKYWAAVSWGRFEIFGLFGWLLRKAADFMGYKDYEPWWTATQLWLADNSEQESCPICAGKN